MTWDLPPIDKSRISPKGGFLNHLSEWRSSSSTLSSFQVSEFLTLTLRMSPDTLYCGSPVLSIHYCKHCINLFVELMLYPTLTRLNKTTRQVSSFTGGRNSLPNQTGQSSLPFTVASNFEGLTPNHNHIILGCKLSVLDDMIWRCQENYSISKKQRCNRVATKLDTLHS